MSCDKVSLEFTWIYRLLRFVSGLLAFAIMSTGPNLEIFKNKDKDNNNNNDNTIVDEKKKEN